MNATKRPMINDALRLLRLYLGLSQKELAVELEISQSMVSEIESGAKSVSMELLERYSAKLDVRMSQLLFFAEELNGEPIKTKGKLIIATRVLSLLEKLSPREISHAS
ncbi:helix-turn-helix domain-containing protein [Rhizobium leguminosarum]|uniref:Transcriptional regulator n=2 Tax=Rhizobium leguminosarum TaxID=384 RepID=A0A154IAG4_RHILE|nr:helix-turn-helix transcriptional regulator [Rhizobium leguminosarum]KZA97087.1 transcriptional regulator [Rhizobium leguminosarum]RWY91927.1 XRE family transcriptional regulator [Rhizobium leguminosarum]